MEADANWAGCPRTRKSTTGVAISLLDGLGNRFTVACISPTQPVIATSSCESELMALSTAASEGTFVRNVLVELGVSAQLNTLSDSSAARSVCARAGVGSRLGHIDIRLLCLQEKVARQELTISKISGTRNPENALTKYLSGVEQQEANDMFSLSMCSTGSSQGSLDLGTTMWHPNLAVGMKQRAS